ncbi:VKOR-domain-containing protein [Fragilariopsis cylindrus CCMP1102]|uniref:VKOR-domain-containing protein n=1 Tax=Fragilariopsis cylindrus CCMP1102 TaxID=635003 RepID=A0A1E7F3L8_9STRA|nr:VKOR-domain-containing protein [Fragilariopsis cylindrus CCMP1102]|eukprot:OEU12729.1 VKOR-domain-containing protein [Fragilariopsis cylindrus CCMP1102]
MMKSSQYYFVSLMLMLMLMLTTTTLSSSSLSYGMIPTAEAFSPPLSSYHQIKPSNNNKNFLRSITTSSLSSCSKSSSCSTTTKIRQQLTKISFSNDDISSDNDDSSNNSNNNNNAVWSPNLRRIMGGIASLGAIETGYLTYAKLFGGINNGGGLLFCGESSSAGYSSCDQVLNGPYSNLPFLDQVPLASLGLVSYILVGFLALQPIISENDDDDDTTNRILLTALTTTMGTFSIFLMTLLFGVLKTECPYCIFSACCSILLANLALIGGCLPEKEEEEAEEGISGKTTGSGTVATGFLSAIIGAVLSSKRALALAKTLNTMDAKMYGAYWCSHCFDQKEVFGKQVFNRDEASKFNIEYVECAKDGSNSQTKLCKSKEVPGYPTWEIKGKLYPGEQELDELEDLVKSIMAE